MTASLEDRKHYLQAKLKMKFPVGRVGMSHCGFESRGRILPSLRQVFASRYALTEQQGQVFVTSVPVTKKMGQCSEGVMLQMGLHHGGRAHLRRP